MNMFAGKKFVCLHDNKAVKLKKITYEKDAVGHCCLAGMSYHAGTIFLYNERYGIALRKL